MFDRIKNVLSSGPKTRWFAQVKEPGFIVSASVSPIEYEKKHDYSHNLILSFGEAVRDGNDISHINIRENDGKVVDYLELHAGDESTGMWFNPVQADYEFVTVTTEDKVHDTATVEIYQEAITD